MMVRTAILERIDWSGRARRRDLWLFLAFGCVVIAGVVAAELWIAAGSPKAPRFVYLTVALLIVPLVSLGVRRLHDRGHGGGWLMLALVPWLGGLVWLYLLLAPSDRRVDAPDTPMPLHLMGLVMAAVVLLLVGSRVFWAPYWIAAGSMKPNLLAGDYVMAGYVQADDLQRGDVVVFRAMPSGTVSMARVIGMPGDSVQMRAGQVVLNGVLVGQTPAEPFVERNTPQGPARSLPRCGNAPVGAGGPCITPRLRETLPDGAVQDVLDLVPGAAADDTAVFDVPPGKFFVLGDNRDDSLDSRFATAVGGVGFVASADVIGRANRVLLSAAGASWMAVWSWQAGRFWVAVP